VNALVGGIVRDVNVELGADVRRNQPLAVVFSNELAEAQMRYLSLRAMLHADEQKLGRTQKLTEIGAASRQELDEATALQASRATEVAAAAQRLQLLGLNRTQIDRLREPSQIVSEVTVSAPADGAVIARAVNTGQVVAAGQELFVVADLSTVWVIGDLYEKDFASVRVGAPATVRLPAAGGSITRGRVGYIDPRVDPATRTAKVRIEVPNRGELRLGVFTEVTFDGPTSSPRLVVPRAAVQAIGARNVVYVATDDEGRFLERTVRLGTIGVDTVEVLDGVKAGERVVSEGSFFLRAEAGRARSSG
jgi:RND family efflux transporter MFP subunit